MTKTPPPPANTPVTPGLAAVTNAPVEGGLQVYLRGYLQRVRGGELGSLPAASGLVVLIILFWAVHPSFGSLGNIESLIDEAAPTILLAMGLIFVLLLGEIDLAAGTTAGVSAAVMARISTGYAIAWPWAIIGAIATGVVIGILTGVLRAKVKIPSFVLTLGIFLALQGVILVVLNNGKGIKGTDVPINDGFLNALENGDMPTWLGWVVAVAAILAYAASKLYDTVKRSRAGLVTEPAILLAIKIGLLTIGALVLVYALNQNRAVNQGSTIGVDPKTGKQVVIHAPTLQGVPWAVLVVLAIFAIWTFVLGRTRYGRHIYAVGGNDEAARRAGIPTDRIRLSVFVICSTMGAVAGIMLASYIQTVNSTLGNGQGVGSGGNTLLLAVGAAVIGGTSLFGGRGRMIDGVLGGLVVAVIGNGMSDLIHGKNNTSIQPIVTGVVLLLAAAVDALSRRRAGSSGLA
ncbi:MAG: sugar ABC transporter permease [Jatrophihabitans sp.]